MTGQAWAQVTVLVVLILGGIYKLIQGMLKQDNQAKSIGYGIGYITGFVGLLVIYYYAGLFSQLWR